MSPETAAKIITGKRNKAQAVAALKEFMPWLLDGSGGLSEEFCTRMREEYRKERREEVREKQRQAGRKTKNLKRGTKISP